MEREREREIMGLSVGVSEKTRLTEEAGLAAGVVVDRAGAAPKEKKEKREREIRRSKNRRSERRKRRKSTRSKNR